MSILDNDAQVVTVCPTTGLRTAPTTALPVLPNRDLTSSLTVNFSVSGTATSARTTPPSHERDVLAGAATASKT